jgi:ribose transport system ATP-binding protein
MIQSITSSQQPMLSARGLSQSFGNTKALVGVNLDFYPGEVHAVIGENGAGKSTAMMILAGVLQCDAGEMTLNGAPYRPANPHQARHLGVSTVFQEGAVIDDLTVWENVFLGCELTSLGGFVDRTAMRAKAQAALRRLGHEIPLDARVGDLSISDRQMVEIARALAVGDRRVIILDEPTSSLGADDRARLLKVVRGLAAQGLAVIYISHFMEEIKGGSDRFTVLRDGQVTGTGITATTPVPQLVRLMLGRTLKELYPRSPHPVGEPLLTLDAITAPGVHGTSLTVHKGQVVGVFGLVGSGRTELVETVFGLTAVRSGQIRLGTNVISGGPAERWNAGIGFVSEDRGTSLWRDLSIAHNLTAVSRKGNGGRLGFSSNRSAHSRARNWMERLGIVGKHPEDSVASLSGGNQQRVALARLLETDCDLWILDEPTRGIDMGARAEIYGLINEAAVRGGAVLVVSSSAEELLGISDVIAVMHRGQLSAAVPVNQLDEHALMLMATSGNNN